MNESYIKLLRKMLSWEWYDDSKMVHIFIHLLLKANYVDGKFKGKDVKRGQLITGRNALSKDTGISAQSVRTCLNKLKSTNEITIESTNDFSLITVVKYNDYQFVDKKTTIASTTKLTNNQPSINQQVTTIEEDNKGIKEEETKVEFESFWNLYNKKVGKKIKIEQKWNRLPSETQKKIMETLPSFLGRISDKQFQPHPETYLNNERWNDEITGLNAGGKKMVTFSNAIGRTTCLKTEEEIEQMKLNDFFTIESIAP